MKAKLIKYFQQEIFMQIILFARTMISVPLPIMALKVSDEREFE
jgi:hypothetical protein